MLRYARNDVQKYTLAGFITGLLLITGCSAITGKSYHEDYGDYEGNRAKATARCTDLGYLPGSPEFYQCVTKEYTKIKGGR